MKTTPLPLLTAAMLAITAMTGIVHGTIESSGCAYFFSKGEWVHVWISD